MELHTLGVDGGYTQQDVQEVARCFTGWTIKRETGEFALPRAAFQHDNGAKSRPRSRDSRRRWHSATVKLVLDILAASNPATAHITSRCKCASVSSATIPPDALVTRIAGVFTQLRRRPAQGDRGDPHQPGISLARQLQQQDQVAARVRRLRRARVGVDPRHHNQPSATFNVLVATAIEGQGVSGRPCGALRTASSKRPRQSLNWHILELGEPLFACTPPTGYKEVSKDSGSAPAR